MKKLSLTTQIAIALVLAVVAGILLQDYADMGRTVMSVTGDASCAVVMQNRLK